MQIRDVSGNIIEGCFQFKYRGFTISASTIMGKSFKVFTNDDRESIASLDSGIEVNGIPEALRYVDSLIIKSRLKNIK